MTNWYTYHGRKNQVKYPPYLDQLDENCPKGDEEIQDNFMIKNVRGRRRAMNVKYIFTYSPRADKEYKKPHIRSKWGWSKTDR